MQYNGCLSVPYFPLIHAPVHYSSGRRSTPLISRLCTRRTPVSPSVLHPSYIHPVSISRYLYSATIFIAYHTVPPRDALYPVFSVAFSRPSSLALSTLFSELRASLRARRLTPLSFHFIQCSLSLLSDNSSRFLSSSLSVSLRARVLPPLVFVIVVSSFSSFARSLTLYALFSRKLPDSRDDPSTFLHSLRSSRTSLTFCAPRRFA